jgi:hypothetical protein
LLFRKVFGSVADMNINTKNMIADELKELLKKIAHAQGIDLTKNRYTIWSENGPWSEDGKHLIYESSAPDMSEKDRKVKECILKTSYSRTLILDAIQDRLEIIPPDGKITICNS